MKSKVIIMVLINSNGDLMAIKVLINGFYANAFTKPFIYGISFKLMAFNIVVNEVEHFTAINCSIHFSELLN